MSFYLGLKNTAQRLISKFGQSVSIAREVNRAVDESPWQNSTDRPHLSFTYSAKAVTDNFQRSEIQFQNVEADDRLLYIAGPFVVTAPIAEYVGEVRFEENTVDPENEIIRISAMVEEAPFDWEAEGFVLGFPVRFVGAETSEGQPITADGYETGIVSFTTDGETGREYMNLEALPFSSDTLTAPNCTVSIGPATGSTVTRPEVGDIVTVDGEALRLVQVERVSPGGTELLYIAQARRA